MVEQIGKVYDLNNVSPQDVEGLADAIERVGFEVTYHGVPEFYEVKDETGTVVGEMDRGTARTMGSQKLDRLISNFSFKTSTASSR